MILISLEYYAIIVVIYRVKTKKAYAARYRYAGRNGGDDPEVGWSCIQGEGKRRYEFYAYRS